MTLQEQRRLARRMIALHGKPYDPETSDDNNRAFEELALKLARRARLLGVEVPR